VLAFAPASPAPLAGAGRSARLRDSREELSLRAKERASEPARKVSAFNSGLGLLNYD